MNATRPSLNISWCYGVTRPQCINVLMLHICLKIDVNVMHKTMESVSIVISIVISTANLTAILFCCYYRHFWQTHMFSTVIFSVKFDGHHPMLILCQTIEFAIVFYSFYIACLINTWSYTYIKYWLTFQVNMMKRTMEIKYLSSFLSSHLTTIFLRSKSLLLSTFLTDLRFFNGHSWKIIEIISSYLSDRQHLKTQKYNRLVTYFLQNLAGLQQIYISMWSSQHNHRFFAGMKLR